jgi:hypothetical protein
MQVYSGSLNKTSSQFIVIPSSIPVKSSCTMGADHSIDSTVKLSGNQLIDSRDLLAPQQLKAVFANYRRIQPSQVIYLEFI